MRQKDINLLKNQDVIFDASLFDLPQNENLGNAVSDPEENVKIEKEISNGVGKFILKTSKEDSPIIEGLSEEASQVVNVYKEIEKRKFKSATQSTIKVGETLGAVTFAYERARNAIDYKSEHLLKRNAIERILKRQLWVNPNQDTQDLSKSLIKELVWAKYLPNDSVPKNKIDDIVQVLDKYNLLFNVYPKGRGKVTKSDWKNWLINIESCEIEEVLDDNLQCTYTYVKSITSWLNKNYEWDENLTESEKNMQVSIAVQKSFAKSDNARIRYFLLQQNFPDWGEVTSDNLNEKAISLYEKLIDIELGFESSHQNKLFRFVQKIVSPFTILKDITDSNYKNPETILLDEKKFEEEIIKDTRERFDDIRKKVRRGIVRSIIYIFITKMLVVLLIEVPFELFYYGSVNPISLSANLLLPPLLMLAIVPTVKPPDEKTLDKITKRIRSFVIPDDGKDKSTFNLNPVKRNSLLQLIFTMAYGLILLMIVLGIIYVLDYLKFNIVSILIFFVFLSLVLLFGFRIRYTATELRVSDDEGGFFNHLITMLSLPFLNLGNFISKSLSKYNFLIIFLDFIIEAPFKNIIGFYDEWSGFLKERREEFIEVPMN